MRRLLAVLALAIAPATAQAGPSQHVDPMIGTFAPGFIVPGASTPFGMVQNSPDTRGEFAYSGYVWHDPTIAAFSLVHLSGPGVKKAGDVGFMPVVGGAAPPTAPPPAPEQPPARAPPRAPPARVVGPRRGEGDRRRLRGAARRRHPRRARRGQARRAAAVHLPRRD